MTRMAALYATLYRMEDCGWVKSRWVEKAGQRRRCYYRITDAGRTVLADQREDWRRFVAALAQVAGVKYRLVAGIHGGNAIHSQRAVTGGTGVQERSLLNEFS